MRPLLLTALLLLASPLSLSAANLSKHLPPDANWVVGLEVPVFLQSPLIHDSLPLLLRLHGPTAVVALLNGHLPHDATMVARLSSAFAEPDAALAGARRLERIQLARTGNRAQSSLFLIAEGRFSAAEVQAFVKQAGPILWPGCGIDTIRLANHDVCRVSPPGHEEVLYIALPDEGTVVATPNRVALARLLDQGDRGRAGPTADLVDLASRIDPTKTPLWMIGAPKATDGLAPCSGGVDFTKGLHGQLTFTARTQEEAQELASDLSEIHEETIDSARDLQHKDRRGQGLVKLLQAITIKRTDKQVVMQLEWQAEEWRRWLSR